MKEQNRKKTAEGQVVPGHVLDDLGLSQEKDQSEDKIPGVHVNNVGGTSQEDEEEALKKSQQKPPM